MRIKDIENYFAQLDSVENVLKVDCSNPLNLIVSIEERGEGVTGLELDYFRESVLPASTVGTVVFYKKHDIYYY